MSNRPESYLYSKSHEWVQVNDQIGTVGITDYAQSELGDVVFIDLPEVGLKVTKGSSMFTVESVKAVSDIYAPVTGKIIEVNESLKNSPELLNQDPFNSGWLVKISFSKDTTSEDTTSDLLNVSDYNSLVSEVSK